MRIKSIKNFKLHIGDLALDKIERNGVPYIIAVSLENPELRLLVTYKDLQLVSTNMSEQQVLYTIAEIKNNKEFL